MKNILVLTDFSGVADNAAEYAVKLAAELKADVTLFHAIKAPEKVLLSAELQEDIDENYEHAASACLLKLDVLSKKLRIILKEEKENKIQLSCLVQEGNVKSCLSEIVTDQKIDLIVMGARLYEEFPGFLFGTNIKGVVDIVRCPILLIHEQVLFRPIRNIVYVSDVRYCDLAAIRQLISFTTALKSEISMLHACAEGLPCLSDKEAATIFRDTIASRINFEHLKYVAASGLDKQSMINRIIERHEMDMLAVANKKYHFLNHLFRKNQAKDTAAYVRIPVLIIPG